MHINKSKAVSLLSDPRAYRRKLKLNQTDFWGRFGVSQSAGSRYETSRDIPLHLANMMVLIDQDYIPSEIIQTIRSMYQNPSNNI